MVCLIQTALEAYVSGAKAVFIELHKLNREQKELLKLFKVIINIDFNNNKYDQKISKEQEIQKVYRCVNIEKNRNIIKKLINSYDLL